MRTANAAERASYIYTCYIRAAYSVYLTLHTKFHVFSYCLCIWRKTAFERILATEIMETT